MEIEYYTCAQCGKEFMKLWKDEEVLAEFLPEFPHVTIDMIEVLCDQCYEDFEIKLNASRN